MNLMTQIDELQKENQALRNEVETLRNSVDQGGERQRHEHGGAAIARQRHHQTSNRPHAASALPRRAWKCAVSGSSVT